MPCSPFSLRLVDDGNAKNASQAAVKNIGKAIKSLNLPNHGPGFGKKAKKPPEVETNNYGQARRRRIKTNTSPDW